MTDAFPTHSRYFTYRSDALFAEDVPLAELAARHGTPLYVYSRQAILDAYEGYERGLAGAPHVTAYSIKANGNLAVVKMLAEAGAGADLTSYGEMQLALRAGVPPERMIFSGVGKSDEEIEAAVRSGILMLNIESEPELDAIQAIAARVGKPAAIAVRVNPDIDAKTHPKITTGLKEHKFGVPIDRAAALYERAAKMPNIRVRGIAAHIGSSLKETGPLLEALDRQLAFRREVARRGIEITHVDVGGGLGINYDHENPEPPEAYAQKLCERVRSEGVTLVVEPGRSIVGNGAVLLARVTFVKRTADRVFVVVDAGMNDLARPAIYGAYHGIVPVRIAGDERETVDVVGPVCESSDVFGRGRVLSQCERGDLLALCSAGAYGYAMASNYNGRLRPAEVLVEGGAARLVRKRESVEDLWRNQVWE